MFKMQQPLHSCAHCGVDKALDGKRLRACARCKCTFYCGKECQTSHWRAGHKNCCRELSRTMMTSIRENSRKTQSHVSLDLRTKGAVQAWMIVAKKFGAPDFKIPPQRKWEGPKIRVILFDGKKFQRNSVRCKSQQVRVMV